MLLSAANRPTNTSVHKSERRPILLRRRRSFDLPRRVLVSYHRPCWHALVMPHTSRLPERSQRRPEVFHSSFSMLYPTSIPYETNDLSNSSIPGIIAKKGETGQEASWPVHDVV